MLAVFTQRFSEGLKDCRGDWHFQSPIFQLALRSAFACILAIFLSLFFHVANPYWSAVSCMTVMVANTGSSIQKSILRFMGTIAGACLALIVAAFTNEDPIIYGFFLFFFCTIGLYCTTIDKKNFYAWLLGTIAFCMVLLGPLSSPNAQSYIDTAFYRSFEIFIGIASATFVQHLIFPKRARDQINEQIHRTAIQCQSILDHYIDCLFEPSNLSLPTFDEQSKNCRSEIEKLISLWTATRHETFFHDNSFKHHGQLLNALANMLELIVTNYRQLPNTPSPYWQAIKTQSEPIVNDAREVLKLLIAYMHDKNTKAEKVLAKVRQFKASWIKLKRHFATMRRSPNGENENCHYHSEQIDTVIASLSVIRLSVYEFEHALDVDNTPPKERYQPKKLSRLKALIDYDGYYLKYAMLATTGILTGPLIWLFLGLPGYSQIAISVAAVIGMNPEATRYKGTLRIAGCLFGVVGVLAFMLMNIQSTPTLLIALFILAFFFLYFHYSNDNVSYFGTQANVVFFIGTVYQFMPDQSMALALERLFGIVSGVTFVVLLQNIFWSYNAQDRVLHHVRQLQKSWYAPLHALCFTLNNDEKIVHLDIAQRLFKKIPNLRLLLKAADDEKQHDSVHDIYIATRDSLRHIYTLNLVALNMLNRQEVRETLPELGTYASQICDLACKSHESEDSIQSHLIQFKQLCRILSQTRQRIREERLLTDRSIASSFDVYVILLHMRHLCDAQVWLLERLKTVI